MTVLQSLLLLQLCGALRVPTSALPPRLRAPCMQQLSSDDDADAPLPAEPAVPMAWDDSSFDNEDGEGWTTPPPPPPPPRVPTKPIETMNVGIVSGPYKRRNGYHAEVVVQHPKAQPTVHALWFAHEVLQNVAKLRGAEEHHIDVEAFAETTVRFLQEKGVDLADPEWGMQDDSIPFSNQHLPLRTLFSYYEELPQYLADALLQDVPDDVVETPVDEAEDVAKITHEMEPGVSFPCLGALAPDGTKDIIGPILEGVPVFREPGEEEAADASPEAAEAPAEASDGPEAPAAE